MVQQRKIQQIATKVETKPSEEVEKAVAAELTVDDPSPEKAEAVLEQDSDKEDDNPATA